MTEAEIVQNYRAARARLWGEDSKPRRVAVPAPEIKRRKRARTLAEGYSKQAVSFRRQARRRHIIENGLFELLPEKMEWQKITNQVTRETGISFAEMCDRTRHHDKVDARRLAWFRIRRDLGYSNCQIARRFGRDTSTVFIGIARYCRQNGIAK